MFAGKIYLFLSLKLGFPSNSIIKNESEIVDENEK